MKTSKYFAQKNEFFNENFLGADGWNNAIGDEWDNADGYGDMQSMISADAEQPANRPPANSVSKPYIIVLENTTTATVEDVIILDSAVRASNFAVSGISITYGLPGITYAQFLSRINSGQTFEVGQVRLIASATSTTNAESQVLTTFTVTTKTIEGNSITEPFVPQKDSFQNQNAQVDIYYRFLVDSMTYITFDSILANTTLKVYLYPSAKTNPFANLKQGLGTTRLANPKTNISLK